MVAPPSNSRVQTAGNAGEPSLVDYNLSLTPEERALNHQRALETINELIKAREQSMENLNLLLKRLLEAKLDFVLVGGYAAVLHGASQVTHDLDICSVITVSELEKLKAALSGLEPRHRMNANFQPTLEEHQKTPAHWITIFLKRLRVFWMFFVKLRRQALLLKSNSVR